MAALLSRHLDKYPFYLVYICGKSVNKERGTGTGNEEPERGTRNRNGERGTGTGNEEPERVTRNRSGNETLERGTRNPTSLSK